MTDERRPDEGGDDVAPRAQDELVSDGWAHRLIRALQLVETAVVVLLTGGLVVLVLAATGFRYLLERPIIWGFEVSQLSLVWLTFMGAALVMSKDAHVTVRILGRRLGPRGRKLLAVLAQVGVIVGGCYFVYSGVGVTMAQRSLRLPISGLPANVPLLAGVLGYLLMTVHAALNLWVTIVHGYVDHEAAEFERMGV